MRRKRRQRRRSTRVLPVWHKPAGWWTREGLAEPKATRTGECATAGQENRMLEICSGDGGGGGMQSRSFCGAWERWESCALFDLFPVASVEIGRSSSVERQALHLGLAGGAFCVLKASQSLFRTHVLFARGGRVMSIFFIPTAQFVFVWHKGLFSTECGRTSSCLGILCAYCCCGIEYHTKRPLGRVFMPPLKTAFKIIVMHLCCL